MNVTFDCTTWNFSFPLVWREQPWFFKDLFTNFIFRSSGFFLGCVSIWTRTYRTHWDCLKLFEVAVLGSWWSCFPDWCAGCLFWQKKRGAGEILGQFLFVFQNPVAVRAVHRSLGCTQGSRERGSLFHGSPACLFSILIYLKGVYSTADWRNVFNV